MKNKKLKFLERILCLSLVMLFFQACGSKAMNPFSVTDTDTSTLGQRNNQPLMAEGGGVLSEDRARTALEVLGEYKRAQVPQPGVPVIRPAEVRLMWIPDHLNKHGDLVPQHYYYLKVLSDRWAVQDAFDIEKQLDEGDESSGSGSSTPWIYKQR